MKKITFLLLFFPVLSCTHRNASEILQNNPNQQQIVLDTIAYHLFDSTVVIIEMTTHQIDTVSHDALNRNIVVYRSPDSTYLWYNNDSFYNWSSDKNAYRSTLGGGFPLISFTDSTIGFSTYMGGVGWQEWQYVTGKKL